MINSRFFFSFHLISFFLNLNYKNFTEYLNNNLHESGLSTEVVDKLLSKYFMNTRLMKI